MNIFLFLQEHFYYVLAAIAIIFLFKNKLLAKVYNVRYMSVEDAFSAYQKSSKSLFLDIRTTWEIEKDPRIKSAKAIPLSELRQRLGEIKKRGADRNIIVVCRSGHRAVNAGIKLKKAGFNNVSVMNGGIAAWQRSGYPVSKPKKQIKRTYG